MALQESNKIEKETLLEEITSLSADVSAWYLSLRIVGVLMVVATLGYSCALLSGFTSSIMNLIIVTVLLGNQLFIIRTRKKNKKLNYMKKTYEAKFGAIHPTK